MRAIVVLVVLALLTVPAHATNVGFEELKIAYGSEPPLAGGVWYPTNSTATAHSIGDFTQTVAMGAPVAGHGLRLVVMSHGGGAWYAGHYDTALALARAGLVVAAISHTGDTFDDQTKVTQLWRRPAQLRRLVDYMLDEWSQRESLNARRVGAFGFSNGGFTVLVTAGGVPDLAKIAPYCHDHPDHDLCRGLKQAGIDPNIDAAVPVAAWIHDQRIKAAVVAAPAFGFAFGRAGLSGVRIPVQLWRAADDRHQPNPYYDEAVRADLPTPPEYHVVQDAGHFDFLPPCDARLLRSQPVICTSLPGFDRAAFHKQFNAEVARFFRAKLR